MKTLFLSLVFFLSCVLAAPVVAQQTQAITLAGYKHQPPVPTSGSGIATVQLKGDTLKVHGSFENLTNHFSGAYIMVSLKGQGGNQLYRLKAHLNEEKTGGTLKAEENTFTLSKAVQKLLKSGDLYINITTFENQRGELRGNIGPMG